MRPLVDLFDPWAMLIALLAGATAVALTAPWQVAAGTVLAVLCVRIAAGSLLATPIARPPASQLQLPAPAEFGSGPGGAITRKEAEIAQLVYEGMRNREIAEKLVISERTVDNHVQHILTKLDFHSRSQIAAWWAERQVSTKK
ncbi:MAG: helix-turn-helix transcriptional regulator [Chloroflexi bacterium]|nr:MAG: helix-turn-helix transcriptional regulator [Chloroflexota bacterium]